MNPETVHYLNIFLGAGAIALQIASLIVLALLVSQKKNIILDLIYKHVALLGFLIALSATAFSMFYSGVVGFLPCNLCWYARVFMFPQLFIFGTALYYKDRMATRYVWPILIAGLAVSLYHNFKYYFTSAGSTLPCDASGVSCYQQLVHEFGGYISIPMLSLSGLLGILVILLVVRFYKQA